MIIFSLLLILSCDMTTNYHDLNSIREAENMLFYDVLDGSVEDIDVYELPYYLSEGDSVGWDFIYYHIEQDSWFFFIDDCPFAYWGHPCRYVFITVESNIEIEVTVINETNPPDCYDEMIQIFQE